MATCVQVWEGRFHCSTNQTRPKASILDHKPVSMGQRALPKPGRRLGRFDHSALQGLRRCFRQCRRITKC